MSWDDAKKRTMAMFAVFSLAAVLLLPTGGDQPIAKVIVRAVPGASAAMVEAVEAAGGSVLGQLGIIEGAVAELPARRVAGLQSHPAVRSVTPDERLRPLHAVDGFDGGGDAGSLHTNARAIGAHDLWGSGVTGRGIDIALIDTGVTPVAGLDSAGKVINGPDLSFDSQVDSRRHQDGYGHGTHLAGIIAGRDASAGDGSALVRDHDSFVGIAPDARLVNVKVGDEFGGADVSQVIAAVDWVVQHRRDNGLNIRVLNLSFGTDSIQSYLDDPLAFAAEVAWHHGIVVVTAAGNGGNGAGRLLNPAHNPYLIAVGADRTEGTSKLSDDSVPAFSSGGDGVRNPDFVAPGVSLASLRVPESHIDADHPGGRVNQRLFRGSGTSQAAAVASGAAALLLQQRPDLSPDQVKALLVATAKPVKAHPVTVQGAGLIDVNGAAAANAPAVSQSWPRSTAGGTLEASRGSHHLVHDGVRLEGERDIFGMELHVPSWASQSGEGTSWQGGAWNGSTWSGSTWSGSSWSGSSWSGSSWSGSSWRGSSWSGSSWRGSSWSGSSWRGSSWSTLYWG